MPSRPNYGIDSPAIVIGLLVLGGTSVAAALLLHLFGDPHRLWRIVLGAVGAYFLLGAGGMLSYSKNGKVRIRDEIMRLIAWRGDEMVLDAGCGRGLLLVGAAGRLTTGKAIGVDLWVPGYLTGNHAQAVLDNARLEGVLDRVAVKCGDVRRLPFADASFDVVLSNFVVHELETEAERKAMLREVVRVLKPGGRLVLVDFIFTAQSASVLRAAGINDASRVRIGSWFSFWTSAILNLGLVQTYAVTGSKPSDTCQEAGG
jgi:SAM-dependent methyltransferase